MLAPSKLDLKTRLEPLLRAIGHRPSDSIAVAVSGGGDSLALLILTHEAYPGRVTGLTVDHGLRAGSGAEARRVAEWCAGRGIAHRILTWEGEKPATGIQARARAARYELLAETAHTLGAPGRPAPLLVAHTLEDQAETFLMRLTHGSDVAGLASMRRVSEIAGAPPVPLLRPLLDVSRDELRCALRARGQDWIEDSSNDNQRFERIRIRKRIDAAPEHLSTTALARGASLFARLDAGLDRIARPMTHAAVQLEPEGYALLDLGELSQAPSLATRLLAKLVRAIGGAPYPPRRAALEALWARLLRPDFRGATLSGCHLSPSDRGTLRLTREMRNAPAELLIRPGQAVLWDRRFFVWRPAELAGEALSVRPLGDAGREVRDVLGREVPAVAVASLPGLWDGARLIAPALPVAERGLHSPGSSFVGLARLERRLLQTWRDWAPAPNLPPTLS
jgi:tRNA(Ile)-lysidine synthase